MSTSELRKTCWRALILLGGLAAGLTAMRCAPPGQCLHLSDCAAGETCSEGACHGDPSGTAADGSDAEGGAASDAPAAETAAVDAAAHVDAAPLGDGAPSADASSTDAATPDAAADF